MSARRVAVVTGASSGIGEATARRLAADGFRVVLGARRTDRLAAIAADLGIESATWHPLDVTDQASVDAFATFVGAAGGCSVLVNNAGGASGLEPIETADLDRWQWMYDANVLGVARVTQALIPLLEASGDGHIVTVGSIAGHQPYADGAGYNAAKFGVRAVMDALRQELLGRPIRVSQIDPGLVETEFSIVRFDGDEARAAKVYDGMMPLSADDVADAIAWTATRPAHVNVASMLLLPRDQANATQVSRRAG